MGVLRTHGFLLPFFGARRAPSVPWVRIELTAFLFLVTKDEGQRFVIGHSSFVSGQGVTTQPIPAGWAERVAGIKGVPIKATCNATITRCPFLRAVEI